MDHRHVAKRLSALLDELGVYHRVQIAATGSVYLHVSHRRDPGESVVRFADHGDCYGSADYSCDGLEGTPSGARHYLLRALGISEAAIRRLRRARRARKTRRLAQYEAALRRQGASEQSIRQSVSAASCAP